MTSINTLIDVLDRKGIFLSVDDSDNLCIRGDKTHLDEGLIADIRKHKEQLVDAIKKCRPFALLTEGERGELGEGYEDAYPLSALQAGMVFHTQLEGFNGIYHDIMADHVKCPWDRSCFEQALAACIQEHPILRTGFRLEGERPLQLVHASMPLPLTVEDLRSQSPAQQDAYLAQWTELHKRHVFDWERGPLFRIHIFRRTDESFEFVISFHHAVLDGWSRAALTTSLYNRYEGLLSGRRLPPVATDWTYRDFIVLEQQVLADPEAKAHFARMLEDAPMPQIPRFPTADRSVDHNAREFIDIGAFSTISPRLMGLARQCGVPVQAVLLAGHFKVLSMLSGQPRALSCVTHNGRPEQQGAEDGLGLFLNSLPIGVELEKGRSWREWIAQVAQVGQDSMAYRRYPLARIQQDIGATLDEVTFNYTHFHVYNDMTQAAERPLEVLGSSGFELTNFDFHIDVMRSLQEDGLQMRLIYKRSLYRGEQMERVARYYVRAYEQMLADPDAAHDASSLLDAEEMRRLQLDWNATAIDYPHDRSVVAQIEEQARRTPDATAVQFGAQRLSYAELDGKASRLARYLREAGVTREACVGIHLSRSPALLIAVLGIWKAGGSYVPLEPGLPRERLGYMVQDAGIGWVLLESAALEGLPLGGVDVVLMDGASDDASWLADYDDGELPNVAADDLAYVIYTSGSTGRPKGVMVNHRGLSNYLAHAVREYLPKVVGSVVSSPLCFDATLTTLLPPLVAGKPVCLLADGADTLQELSRHLFAEGEGWLFKITPAHLEALSYLDREQASGQAAHCIVIGGEQLGAATLQRWKGELLRQASFVNEYGPTETVVGCSVWWLSDAAQLPSLAHMVAAPIGRAIGNTQLYVLNDARQMQPIHSVGELYIGGAGVARGYLNRDELTQDRFIPNPFGEGRLYRTGDLVRYGDQHELEFLGRSDDQVKIRGFRVELGEIEGRLRLLAGVREAVVMVREDTPGQKRLVAYVVGTVGTGALREGLAAALPDYMVPAAFVSLEVMPLTPNGKVDKRALPSPDGTEGAAAEYVPPRTETEQALCEVWAEVLKRERVGVDDNFFSLGGDSILSIRIVALLKKRGLQLDIKDIFQNQTIAQLAPIVDQWSEAAMNLIDNKKIERMFMRERDESSKDDVEIIV